MAIEIVDFPIKNGWIFPWQNVSSPEGTKKILRIDRSSDLLQTFAALKEIPPDFPDPKAVAFFWGCDQLMLSILTE